MKTTASPLTPRFECFTAKWHDGTPMLVSTLPAPTLPPNAALTCAVVTSLHGLLVVAPDAEPATTSAAATPINPRTTIARDDTGRRLPRLLDEEREDVVVSRLADHDDPVGAAAEHDLVADA